MDKATTIVSKYGHIDVFVNAEKNILYAIPHGYVGPYLVKKDLKFLADFDEKSQVEWKYIVDTSKAKVIHPVNPFLLKGLTQLSKMKEYVVYAPSPVVRTLLKLSNWINKPDRIIKTNEALQIELKNIQ